MESTCLVRFSNPLLCEHFSKEDPIGEKNMIAGVVVFVLWAVVDFIVHGWILQGAYAATARFWRPMAEMKMGLMYFTTLISALAFSAIFGFVSDKKGFGRGIPSGLLYGIGVGSPWVTAFILICRFLIPWPSPGSWEPSLGRSWAGSRLASSSGSSPTQVPVLFEDGTDDVMKAMNLRKAPNLAGEKKSGCRKCWASKSGFRQTSFGP